MALADVDHQHMVDYRGFCITCGKDRNEMRAEAQEDRAITAFNRLADILEKLEKKL